MHKSISLMHANEPACFVYSRKIPQLDIYIVVFSLNARSRAHWTEFESLLTYLLTYLFSQFWSGKQSYNSMDKSWQKKTKFLLLCI